MKTKPTEWDIFCIFANKETDQGLISKTNSSGSLILKKHKIKPSSWTLEHWLCGSSSWDSLPQTMWDLPRSGIQPVTPALAGGLLTTRSPVLCLVAQWCSAVCNLMDYCPPGSSVHGIFQARKLEQVATFFSRGSSQPRIELGSLALQVDPLLTEL